MFMPEYEDSRSGGFRNRFQRIKDRMAFRGTKLTTTTVASMVQVRLFIGSKKCGVDIEILDRCLGVRSSVF
jgi:hypothetical protein